jgi:hypothetical protein
MRAADATPFKPVHTLRNRVEEVAHFAQVGLCVGHDLVLQEECDAPVTTLVVKDRALDHHTVDALRP